MLALSVIVTSFNTRHLLHACLDSLREAETPAQGAEIIVVDNGSSDGSVAMVRAEHPEVKLLPLEANLGFAAANNLGAAAAAGEALLFLNSDTQIGRDGLVRPLEYLRAHREVGALTVKLARPDGRLDPGNHRAFPTPWNALCHFSGLGRLFPRSALVNAYQRPDVDMDRVHDVEVIAGSYLMTPSSVFRRIGGWDESYYFYGEDVEYCYRLHQQGLRVIYFPEVAVLHHKGASSGLHGPIHGSPRPSCEVRIRAARESARAMRIFYGKHYRTRYPAPVRVLVFAGIQVREWSRILRELTR